ncbi:hypothetical protein LOTGIDRAFT_176674, partial [Lottia gigantea]
RAASLSGDVDLTRSSQIYNLLYQREPGVQLLYVTPEKIVASDKLLSCFQHLYNRKVLDRFVIDEAHCVSQVYAEFLSWQFWGFYKFMQSFNRGNLKYYIRMKKPKNAVKDVYDVIKSKFNGDIGVIYCLSRKECDTTASELQRQGIQAVSYHAGLSDSERYSIQEQWLYGDKK